MTTRPVTNDATMTSAIAAAVTGDIIEIQNGAALGDTNLAGLASGVKITAQSLTGHTVARLRFEDVPALELTGVNIQLTGAAGGANNDPLVYMGGNNAGFWMHGCRVRCGVRSLSFADMDPTNAGGIYDSMIGVSQTTTYPASNYFWDNCPPLIGRSLTVTGDFTIEDNDLEDGNDAIILVVGGGATQKIRANRFRRMYSDCIRIAWPSGAYTPIVLADICANTFINCCWAQPQDKSNPHGDYIQPFNQEGSSTTPIGNFVCCGNLAIITAGFRGQGQRFFGSDIATNYPFVAPLVAQNFLLSRITNKGIFLNNDNISGCAYAFVDRNTVLTLPTNNAPIQNELYPYDFTDHSPSPTVIPASSSSASLIDIVQSPAYGGKNYCGRNITEALGGRSYTDQSFKPNIATGRATGATSYNTWITPPADWNALVTTDDFITAYKPKTAYDDYGAIRPTDDAATFLARWAGDTKPYSDLPSYVGINSVTNSARSTLVTSEWGYIWAGGGPGSAPTRAITVSAGLEWRQADNTSGLNATAWSASSGTVTHGKFLQVRQTTSANGSTTVSRTYTVGTETFTWSATTLATSNYPLVDFDGTQIIRQTSGAGILAVTSKVMTLAFELSDLGAAPGATVNLTSNATGSAYMSIQRLTTGRIRVSALGGRGDFPIITDTSRHLFMVTFDTAQATAAAGIVMYVDGVAQTPANTTWVQDTTTDWDSLAVAFEFGGNGATPQYPYNLGMFWFFPGQWLDLSVGTNRDFFSAPYIGPSGEAPFAAAPPVFLVGQAATYNSGNPNRGTGQSWSKVVGNSLADVGTDVWPPVLVLTATVLTAGPYAVGVPIDVLVQAVGYPKSNNITAASDKAGTWDASPKNMPLGSNGVTFTFTPSASGLHTFTFTNDGGYDNPTSPTVDVAASGVTSAPPHRTLSLGLSLSL